MSPPLQFEDLDRVVLPDRPLHLAIGMFDGVHLGHRAVIEAAVQTARRHNGVAAVLTFWPHPSALFRAENPTRLIQDGPAKARVLERLGVAAVITQPFTQELARVPAEDFLAWLKKRLPSLAAIYVGENFRFGRGRKGDAAVLRTSGQAFGIGIFVAPPVSLGGEAVSSTRIRRLLETGEIEAANALLGYDYFAAGIVVPGKRLGRTIGFPTLNLAWSPALRPRLGVYAVRVSGAKSVTPLPAVANYGLRPTMEQVTEPQLEVHVLGACPFGEGDRIVVEWVKFLRPEMKFVSVEELRTQIAKDRDVAQTYFSSAV